MDTNQEQALDQELDQLIEALKSSSSSTGAPSSGSGQAETSQPDSLMALELEPQALQALVRETACADCQASTWLLWEDEERLEGRHGPVAVAYCRALYQHTHVPGRVRIRRCGDRQPTGRTLPQTQPQEPQA